MGRQIGGCARSTATGSGLACAHRPGGLDENEGDGRPAMGTRSETAASEPSASWASSEAIRRTMLACRSRDTRPEKALRSVLHAMGLRFRVCTRPIPDVRRTADVVFTRARVAVFVDGCFWHGCPEHYRLPRTNTEYWDDKITGNCRRDAHTNSVLHEAGWTVVRIWEHEEPDAAASVVAQIVAEEREQADSKLARRAKQRRNGIQAV